MTRNFRDDGNIDTGKLTDAHLKKLSQVGSRDFLGQRVRFKRQRVKENSGEWVSYSPEDLEIADMGAADRIASSIRNIATKLLEGGRHRGK